MKPKSCFNGVFFVLFFWDTKCSQFSQIRSHVPCCHGSVSWQSKQFRTTSVVLLLFTIFFFCFQKAWPWSRFTCSQSCALLDMLTQVSAIFDISGDTFRSCASCSAMHNAQCTQFIDGYELFSCRMTYKWDCFKFYLVRQTENRSIHNYFIDNQAVNAVKYKTTCNFV